MLMWREFSSRNKVVRQKARRSFVMGKSEEGLEAARSRALDLYRPTGALMTAQYLERKQEVVAVNKSDLEDIMTFDGLQTGLSSLGLFLLSGALWLGLDKALTMDVLSLTPILAICVCSIVGGGVLLTVGVVMGRKKRDKISRIFNETKPLS